MALWVMRHTVSDGPLSLSDSCASFPQLASLGSPLRHSSTLSVSHLLCDVRPSPAHRHGCTERRVMYLWVHTCVHRPSIRQCVPSHSCRASEARGCLNTALPYMGVPCLFSKQGDCLSSSPWHSWGSVCQVQLLKWHWDMWLSFSQQPFIKCA